MKRLSRLGPSALAACLVLSCGKGRSGSEKAPALAASKASSPSTSAARWRPIPLGNPRAAAAVTFAAGDGELVIEESGSRWFLPTLGDKAGGPPRTTPWSDEEPVASRIYDVAEGLTVVTREGRLLHTKEPLGAFVEVTKLPEDAVPQSTRRFAGATTVLTKAGLTTAIDGGAFVSVKGLDGYAPREAALDAAGVGVGLFVPEQVAVTRDRGATWTKVATPGISAQSLRAEGGLVLLWPGGVRDGFARSVDPRTGVLDRVVASGAMPRPRRGRGDRRAISEALARTRRTAPVPGEPPSTLSAEAVFGPLGHRRAPALDGDEVVVFGEPWKLDGDPHQPFARGRLGDPLEAFPPKSLPLCWVEAAALCGDLVAVLCGTEHLHLFRGRELVWKRQVEGVRALGFGADGGLWSASTTFGTTELTLVRHDIEDESRNQRRQAEGLGGSDVAFVGGCHAPAQWVVGEGGAARLGAEGAGEVVPLPKNRKPIGVDKAGKLVTSSGGELFFSPGDERVSVPAHLDGHVSFASDGAHALLVTPSGQLRQSDDGGRTFRTILTPPVTKRLPVLCGARRCVLGRGSVREGWETLAAPPDWPEPTEERGAKAPQPKITPDPKMVKLAFQCREDAGAFRGASRDLISPRLGATLFAAAGTTDAGVPAALFGDVEARLTSAPLELAAADEPGERAFVAGVVGRVRMSWLGGMATTARFRWDASAPVHTLRTGRGSPVPEAPLLAEQGLANVDRTTSELWLFGKNAPTGRFVPLEPRTLPPGILHVAKDDGWLVAMGGETGVVRVASVPLVENAVVREVLVGGETQAEHAVGMLEENGLGVVLLEAMPDGGAELRVRAVSGDLSLGPPEAIPGTQTPDGRLLRLPTCLAGAPGQLVRVTVRGARAVQLGDKRLVGRIVRLLRVTKAAACVERTLLTSEPEGGRAQLVVGGDGGLAAAAPGAAGHRCDPLLTE